MATNFPYDIYFPTTAEECKDPHGRIHLSCRRSRDTAGRELIMIHDPLGNASRTLGLPRTRGCVYPAAALVFAPNGGLGTVSIGTGEHMPMDQWLRRSSSRDRYVVRVGPCGRRDADVGVQYACVRRKRRQDVSLVACTAGRHMDCGCRSLVIAFFVLTLRCSAWMARTSSSLL